MLTSHSEKTDKVWRPFHRQEEFLQIPDSIFEGLYGGAAGGGKSDCLMMLPIVRGFYNYPDFKGIIFRRTYPELEKEIILRSKVWYKLAGANYNDQKKMWSWPSGAIMQFAHCENEQDIRKYDTAEYNYAAFDELTSFTEFQYLYFIMSRMRSKVSSNLPCIVRSGTNPGNIGHGWTRKRFVEPAKYGTIILDKSTELKRIFIQSLYTDNPHVDTGYGQRLSALPEAERRAKRDGDWWTFSGQVFSDWRLEPFSDEPENAKHVIAPYEIPLWWPHFLAIDWGYSAMTYALFSALSPSGQLISYDEYVSQQQGISVWATEIGRKCLGTQMAGVVLCKSAWQNHGDGLVATKFEQYSGLAPSQPDNDRVSGKLLIQEYLRWTPKPHRYATAGDKFDVAKANEILRVHGLKAYHDYLLFFKESEPEENLPKLQVFNNCTVLIETVPLCVYDEDNKEDVKEFEGDDPYDTLRYKVKLVDSYVNNPRVDAANRKRIAILKELDEKKDQTAFYRKMERFERETRNLTPKPIRRFHRRAH